MKIRNGFVSNSSSASFILEIETNLDKDIIIELIKQSDIFKLSHHVNLVECCFGYRYVSSTSMFNGWDSLREWPFVKMLCDNILKEMVLINIKVSDSDNGAPHKVNFEKEYSWENCWENKNESLEIYNNYLKKVRGELLSHKFLKNMPLSNEEIVEMTKYQLKK